MGKLSYTLHVAVPECATPVHTASGRCIIMLSLFILVRSLHSVLTLYSTPTGEADIQRPSFLEAWLYPPYGQPLSSTSCTHACDQYQVKTPIYLLSSCP